MKIEPAKNHSAERKESKNVFQTETSNFTTSNPQLKPSDAAPASAASAFSKILEETRKQNGKENSTAQKADAGDSDAKTSKSEKDEKTARAADQKKETDERGGKNGDSDARQNADENQAQLLALAGWQTTNGAHGESKTPAARSILHVADLERIVSAIRTESFQNQKQVLIDLKNSVLQGLRIRLTLTESGKIKAEFLALDEQIKKQLNQRKAELSEILKNRSALFSEVEVKSQTQEKEE